MKHINETHVIAFFAGAIVLYIGARIAAPTIKRKIADGVAREFVNKQRTLTGTVFADYNTCLTEIGNPIANDVMEAMYLS